MTGSAVVAPCASVRPGTPPRDAWAVMCSVVFALYLRELKGRLGGRWWGLVWTVGEPLTGAAVMLLVYGALKTHAIAGVDTLLFLLSGLVPFQLFKSLVLRLMESIDANQGLFAYRQVRPLDAVLARAAVEVTLACMVLGIALAVLAWLGHDVLPARPLELLPWVAMLMALGTAGGLLAAAATAGALVRSRAVVRVAFVPMMLASGVLFPLAALPPALREVLMLNPVAQLLEGLRSAWFGSVYVAAPGLSAITVALWTLAAAPLALALARLRRDALRSS